MDALPSSETRRKLNAFQRNRLDRDGYLLLKGVLDTRSLQTINSSLERLLELEGAFAGQIGKSNIRELLLQRNRPLDRIMRRGYDANLRVFNFFMQAMQKRIPGFRQYLWNYSTQQCRIHYGISLSYEFGQLVRTTAQMEYRTDRICDLVNKGEEFDVLYTHPLILDAVEHLVGPDFKLSSLNLRSPRKGCPKQDLHFDWPWEVRAGDCYACNALWILDEMDAQNGATRLVPGSHLRSQRPQVEMANVQDPHPDEIIVAADPGDVLILNAHTWHGGTENTTDKRRFVVQSYFVHRSHPAQLNQRKLLLPETRVRLGETQFRLLDVPDF